jgi:ubiquinone/menaquinone biosynthesis C-methylase UbiE
MLKAYSKALNSHVYYIPHEFKHVSIVTNDKNTNNDKLGKFALLASLCGTNKRNIYNRLLGMLNTGKHGNMLCKIFLNFINNEKDDISSIKLLSDTYDNCMKAEKDTFRNLDKRADNRGEHIKKMLDNCIMEKLNRNCKYLDYGGNLPYNAMAVSKIFNSKNNIAIVDIIPPKFEYPPNIEYKQLTADTSHMTEYPSNNFNLITAFMIIHHMSDEILNLVIKEWLRILEPGGIIAIREHNLCNTFSDINDTYELTVLLDCLHIMHTYVWKSDTDFYDNNKDVCLCDQDINMKTTYRSFINIKKIFENSGFISYRQWNYKHNYKENFYNSGYMMFMKPITKL